MLTQSCNSSSSKTRLAIKPSYSSVSYMPSCSFLQCIDIRMPCLLLPLPYVVPWLVTNDPAEVPPQTPIALSLSPFSPSPETYISAFIFSPPLTSHPVSAQGKEPVSSLQRPSSATASNANPPLTMASGPTKPPLPFPPFVSPYVES